MKKLLIFLFSIASLAAFGQAGSISHSVYRSRVNDSTSVNGAHASGYGDFYWSAQQNKWRFWNGSAYADLGTSGGGGVGDVVGLGSSVDGNLAIFSGISGKIIQDGGSISALPYWPLAGSASLTAPVTIDNAGNTLDFTGAGNVTIMSEGTTEMQSNDGTTFSYLRVNNVGTRFVSSFDTGGSIYNSSFLYSVTNTAEPEIWFGASKNNGAIFSEFFIGTDSTIFWSNDPSFRGAEYHDDYSANFVDRSLIDKGYGDLAYIKTAGTSIMTGTATITTGSTLSIVGTAADKDLPVLIGKSGGGNLTFTNQRIILNNTAAVKHGIQYPVTDGSYVTTDSSLTNRGYVLAAKTFTGAQTFRAGTATAGTAPTYDQAGTLLTTAVAGAKEYDGKAFYSTTANGGRGVIPSVQFTSSTATFAFPNDANANPVFTSANDAFTLESDVTYFFEGMYEITGMGATTRTTATVFGGTASLASIRYYAMIQTGAANATGTAQSTKSCVTATANVLNATATTAAEIIYVRGIVRCTTGGTFIPQVQHSANPTGTIVVAVNSWFKLEPMGSSTVLKRGNVN